MVKENLIIERINADCSYLPVIYLGSITSAFVMHKYKNENKEVENYHNIN